MASDDFQDNSPDSPPSRIDFNMPSSARMYDYYLGGKDNYEVDRRAADEVLALFPDARVTARANRDFLQRVVGDLAKRGVRQFLDIGTGIPTSPNTHEVAQDVDSRARIVYVDHDPMVLAHARALLRSHPAGATAYIDADLRQPDKILRDADLSRVLDLGQPVALLLIAILHFIEDSDDPVQVVAALMDALPSGSYLAVSHGTADFAAELDLIQQTYRDKGVTAQFRTRAEVGRFFTGLEMLPPGLSRISDWLPDTMAASLPPAAVSCYGAVARKP